MIKLTTYTTTQVRTALGDLFDRTRLTSEHFKIVRKNKTQGYVVPPEWYEQARAAMGDPLPGEPPTER